MTDQINWPLAARTAIRMAPRGPVLTHRETRSAVAMMRELALEAIEPVQRVTGLIAPAGSVAQVTDRPGWIESNIAGMRIGLRVLWEGSGNDGPPAVIRSIGAQGSAVQLGAVLGWLSGKVLGQYEVFTEPGQSGRLLLVAPTIVAVEQQLQVPPRDFRLWVCLHEETHRVQFGSVPWLGDYLASLVDDFIRASDLTFAETMRRLVVVLGVVAKAKSSPGGQVTLLEAAQSPEQRVIFDSITGLMSLLEGHADVVMDEVGPQIIPSVALIRERFTARRNNPKALDALARRALGMDLKLRQYSQGADFVRKVMGEVGMSGFNKVWSAPETLPTRAEILDPGAWVRRMNA